MGGATLIWEQVVFVIVLVHGLHIIIYMCLQYVLRKDSLLIFIKFLFTLYLPFYHNVILFLLWGFSVAHCFGDPK